MTVFQTIHLRQAVVPGSNQMATAKNIVIYESPGGATLFNFLNHNLNKSVVF